MKKSISLIVVITIPLLLASCKKNVSENQSEQTSHSASRAPKAKIKHTDDIPIVNAVNNCDANEVKNLLKKEVFANLKNKYGVPVLILAAYNGEDWVVEHLLNGGADINTTDRDGWGRMRPLVPMRYRRLLNKLIS